MTPSPQRRRLLAGIAAVVLGVGLLAPGGASAAAAPDPCAASDAAAFVCRAYASFARRPATEDEVARWAPEVPARRTSFVATLARGAESRAATVAAYYARFDGRAPTPADVAYWSEQVVASGGLRRLEAALLAHTPTTDGALVALAFDRLLGRAPSGPDVSYWRGRIGAIGRNRVVAAISATAEARRTRVRWAYQNEILLSVDPRSRDYWAERLRTGTSYLDLRIALRASPDGYRASGDSCSPPAPQTGPTCALPT